MELREFERNAFGTGEGADDEALGSVRPVRAERSDAPRRGPGVFKLLLLMGSLASVCLFAVSALMPCGVGARPGLLPRDLVAAACARQDVFGRILTLRQQLHAIAMVLR
jgi:hypothetical protein